LIGVGSWGGVCLWLFAGCGLRAFYVTPGV